MPFTISQHQEYILVDSSHVPPGIKPIVKKVYRLELLHILYSDTQASSNILLFLM